MPRSADKSSAPRGTLKDAKRFNLRLPPAMYDELERISNADERSMNVEVVERLALTFEAAATDDPALLAALIESLAARLKARLGE